MRDIFGVMLIQGMEHEHVKGQRTVRSNAIKHATLGAFFQEDSARVIEEICMLLLDPDRICFNSALGCG